MNSKEIVNKMVNVYDQIDSINEDMKTLKEEAKAIGVDGGILATVAKAISAGKSGKLRGKYEETLDILDKVND